MPILRDLGPTWAFLSVLTFSHNIIAATGLAISLGIGQVGLALAQRKPIAALQWVSLGLVCVFGAATLVTHDPRFLMVKPSLVFAAVGLVFLKPGWQAPYIPPVALPYIPRTTLVTWGFVWAGLLFVLSGLNLFFAFETNLHTWALFSAFAPTGAILTLFAAQYLSLRGPVRAALLKSGQDAAAIP